MFGQVKDAAQSILAQDNLDFMANREFGKAVMRSEIVAKATEGLKAGDISSSLEGKNVMSHLQRINNVRVPVSVARMSFDGPPEYLSESADDLIRVYEALHDPFDWVKKVIMHFTSSFKESIDVTIPDNPPKLQYRNPIALWQLMDTAAQMAVETAQNGNQTSMKFSWDYFKRHVVISFIATKSSERFADLESHAARLNAAIQTGTPSGGKRLGLATIEIRVPFKSGAPGSPDNENRSGTGGSSVPGENNYSTTTSAGAASLVNISSAGIVYSGFNCRIPIFAPALNPGTLSLPAPLHI